MRIFSALSPALGAGSHFGGADPLLGRPWYHADLTREAARCAGWDPAPSDDLAWNAVGIDLYCFDPTWRFRARPSRANPGAWTARAAAVPRLRPALSTLHFLDLFTVGQVQAAWRRIAGGTLAGLDLAARAGDVASARLVVGLSLHAMQDFYAHSTWVNDAGRRGVTWFAARPDQRGAVDLWSAGHFRAAPAGRAPHGHIRRRVSPAAVAPARPARIFGSRLAARFVELEPGGITLDAPWMTGQTAVARGFPASAGEELFDAAYALALQTGEQWLRLLDDAMRVAGHGEFWRRVRSQRLDRGARTGAFESPGAFAPYCASAGAAVGIAEPPGRDGWWFALARLTPQSGPANRASGRAAGGGDVVPLGPWPDLPGHVFLATRRPVTLDRVELFVWRVTARPGDAGVTVTAGTGYDRTRVPRVTERLCLPLDPDALHDLQLRP